MIPNAVDFARQPRLPRADDGILDITSVGVVADHKGPHLTLEAVRLAAVPAVRFTLIGLTDPPYAARLRRMARGVPGLELLFYGAFEPAELPALLAGTDAVVVSSLVAESFSIVTREAFACGIPVVAPRSGALPEAVRDGENGLLYEPGDAAALGAALHRLRHQPGLLARLVAGVADHDWVGVHERTSRLTALLNGLRAIEVRPDGEDVCWQRHALHEALAHP